MTQPPPAGAPTESEAAGPGVPGSRPGSESARPGAAATVSDLDSRSGTVVALKPLPAPAPDSVSRSRDSEVT